MDSLDARDVKIWPYNSKIMDPDSSLHSFLAIGQILLSGSSPVLLWENQQEAEEGKKDLWDFPSLQSLAQFLGNVIPRI